MKDIYIVNTQTKTKEIFKPQEGKKAKVYVCGVTPYDHAHLGHGRCYVTFDVLYRVLILAGYEVTYVRNVTDIDDKLLNKAAQQKNDTSYLDLARFYEQSVQEDLSALQCYAPTYEPRVTEHMPQIIDFIAQLIAQDKAYVVDHDVYFSIDSFAAYGKLSGRKLEDMQFGARVQVNDKKRNPADFILWKGNDENLFWQAPWGHGRPGWHIECSALAKEYLGETIDIHGGGMDLIFPHHENEVTQSESLSGKPFSRYWMHNAFVTMNCEKMSKSLGNCCSLKELFKTYDPMVVRFYYLQHHYRTPIDFSDEGLEAAHKAYKKIVNAFEQLPKASIQTMDQMPHDTIVDEFIAALCDDLNTTKAIGIIFEHLSSLAQVPQTGALLKALIQRMLGLTLEPLAQKEVAITPQVQELIDRRNSARAEKNWALADEIRDQLRDMGVTLEDKKS